MTRKAAEKRLLALGFAIDWNVTGPAEGYWSGTIDTLNNMMIEGDCRGVVVHGANASDWYRNAIEKATEYQGNLTPCADPDCDLHHPEGR